MILKKIENSETIFGEFTCLQEGWSIATELEMQNFYLNQAKNKKTAEIRSKKEIELYKPVLYLNRTFISSERASGNIVGALQIITGDVFNWLDSNGSPIAMTRAEFEGLGMVIFIQRNQVYANEAAKYLEIENAETIEEIEAIEW